MNWACLASTKWNKEKININVLMEAVDNNKIIQAIHLSWTKMPEEY